MHNRAYLSLGSNTGDRTANLHAAIEQISQVGNVLAVSSFYETEPVEFTSQPWFLNCVVSLETENSPSQLLQGVLAIEQAMGRRRTQDKGPRNIDIDVLLYGDQTVDRRACTFRTLGLRDGKSYWNLWRRSLRMYSTRG